MSHIRFLSVINEAHRLVRERAQAGDFVIDATMGNGNDTLFLSRCVGASGFVFGFDIQAQALVQTRERLIREKVLLERVELIAEGHEHMERIIPSQFHGEIAAIMFNLGYLPGGDGSLITMTNTTIRALDGALRLLRSGGILTIVLYPGHMGGDEEATEVNNWATKLPPNTYQVMSYQFLNPSTTPPYLIAVYII